jgi:hypothetical protein
MIYRGLPYLSASYADYSKFQASLTGIGREPRTKKRVRAVWCYRLWSADWRRVDHSQEGVGEPAPSDLRSEKIVHVLCHIPANRIRPLYRGR